MISGVSTNSSYAYTSRTTASTNTPTCTSRSTDANETLFKLLDSNSDGSVDKDELTTALNTAKESDTSLADINIDDLFAQLDANSDGSISTGETATLAPPPPPHGPNPEELFASLDSDSDGSVSTDELTAALGSNASSDDITTLFASLDSDEDGSLSPDETNALAGPPPPPPASSDTDKNALYASLVQALMKQYETGAGTTASSVGSQISIAA